MAVTRFAESTWAGDLINGSGSINYVSSGALSRLPVTWAARTEQEHNGRTSPEELLAAAHSACFSMAFASRLAKNGTPATTLDVKAVITFDKGEAGWGITRSDLTVRATVPGVDEAKFQELAEDAKNNCPISQALDGSIELSVDATLAG
jgi:osmotically inducible protein OsmC